MIGARYAQYGGVHYSGPKFVDAYPLAIAPEANNGVKGYRLTFENGNGGAAPATLHSSQVSLPFTFYFRICISVTPTGDQTDRLFSLNSYYRRLRVPRLVAGSAAMNRRLL